jgi:hypothetical protein
MVKSLIRALVGLRSKLRGFGLIKRAAKSLRIEQRIYRHIMKGSLSMTMIDLWPIFARSQIKMSLKKQEYLGLGKKLFSG